MVWKVKLFVGLVVICMVVGVGFVQDVLIVQLGVLGEVNCQLSVDEVVQIVVNCYLDDDVCFMQGMILYYFQVVQMVVLVGDWISNELLGDIVSCIDILQEDEIVFM